MVTKPNYFKLGLFILIALFLLVAGIVFCGSGVMGQKKTFFETYFEDSVSGLSPGASVQENGVDIGTVETISFIRNDYPLQELTNGFSKYRPYVRVVCSVRDENLPEMSRKERQKDLDVLIKNGLRLRLSTNILTGQGIIEAKYLDAERFPVEAFPWETEFPYIPSAPSTFTTLQDSVDRILRRLEQIETEKIGENLNSVLESINKVVNELDISGVSGRIETLLDNANQGVEEIRQTNQHLTSLLKNPNSQQDLGNVAELVDQLNITIGRIDQLVRTQSPRVMEVSEGIRQLLDRISRLVANLEEHPSELLFSQPPEKKEAE